MTDLLLSLLALWILALVISICADDAIKRAKNFDKDHPDE